MMRIYQQDRESRRHRVFMPLFTAVLIILAFVLLGLFSGCAAMDGYDRSHSFTYQDAEGRSMNYAINLRSTKGYAK